MAAKSAEILYRQCQVRTSSVEQRECYPAVEKQSEAELVVAEKRIRAAMVELENISEGSRSMHPVQAFDHAEQAYRAFRAAESQRVLASYGSGNGSDLAASQTYIEMNPARIKLLGRE
ncbi:DUF1311 domain-containing protein [Serratia sp. SRS-8-S-2018]|nr:DUF1311 domain-containing protein [Serratia sp. SRS-8-S-2018]